MKRVLTNIFSATLISTLLLTPVIQGQTLAPKSNAKNSGKNENTSRILPKYVEDLSSLSETGRLTPAEGLESEIEKVKAAFSLQGKGGTILVDKTRTKARAVVETVAALMKSETASALRQKRVLRLDLPLLLNDAQTETQAVALLQNTLKAIEAPDVILFIEDVSTLSRQNPMFGLAIADTIRAAMDKRALQIVTDATPDNYNLEVAVDFGLRKQLRRIDLDERDEIIGNDGFVGDKISPDLRALLGTDPNKTVKVILQSDDINNAELQAVLKRNNVSIENRAESLNMMVLELPARVAEEISAVSSAKHHLARP